MELKAGLSSYVPASPILPATGKASGLAYGNGVRLRRDTKGGGGARSVYAEGFGMEPSRAPETMLELLPQLRQAVLTLYWARTRDRKSHLEFAARACPGSRRYAAHYFRHHGSHACWSASGRYRYAPNVRRGIGWPPCAALFFLAKR